MDRRDRKKIRRDLERIRQVLLHEWDPIGVAEHVEAQDEYDAYAGQVYRRLIRAEPERALFEYLWWLETEWMGLIGNRAHTEIIAAGLVELRDGL